MLAIGAIESIDAQHILGWAWYRPTPDEPIDIEVLVDDAVVLTARADRLRPDLAALGAGNGRHGFLVRNLAEHLPPGPHNVRVRRARDRLDIPGSPKPVIGPEREAVDIGPVVGANPNATSVAENAAAANGVPVGVGEAAEVAVDPDAAVANVKAPGTVSAVEAGEVVAGNSGAAGPETAGVAKARPIGNLDRVSFDEISGWVWDAEHPDQSLDIEILDGDVVVLKVSADQLRSDLADAGMGTGHHGFAIRNLGGILPLSRHRVRVRRAPDGKDLPHSPTDDQPQPAGPGRDDVHERRRVLRHRSGG